MNDSRWCVNYNTIVVTATQQSFRLSRYFTAAPADTAAHYVDARTLVGGPHPVDLQIMAAQM